MFQEMAISVRGMEGPANANRAIGHLANFRRWRANIMLLRLLFLEVSSLE
jgi:hypothetical protein